MFDQQNLLFCPVGTEDSTGVVIKEDIVLQVDLRHIEAPEVSDCTPIVDKLIEELCSDNENEA